MHILCCLAPERRVNMHIVCCWRPPSGAQKSTKKMTENWIQNGSEIKVFRFKLDFWTSREAQMPHARPSKASRRPSEVQNGPFRGILGPRKEPLFVYLSKSSKLLKSLEIHSTKSRSPRTFAKIRL